MKKMVAIICLVFVTLTGFANANSNSNEDLKKIRNVIDEILWTKVSNEYLFGDASEKRNLIFKSCETLRSIANSTNSENGKEEAYTFFGKHCQ